jgi:acetylornithine deacetylase/succinyl-diaminopimelate desuccinylase-like protein
MAKTAGGHSWADYGQPSAVHELAELVTQLTAIRLPREPRTTMNVGTFRGGTGVNVLASEARCELDLRSEEPKALSKLVHQVEKLLKDADREGVRIMAEIIGERPTGEIPVDHPLVQLAVDCTREQGLEAVLTIGSTDANIPLSLGIPAVVMGITTGGGAHTLHEYIDTDPVGKGLDGVVRFVELVG